MNTDKLNAAIKRLLDIDPWDCTPDEINEAQEFMRIHVAPQPPAAPDQPLAAGPTADDFRALCAELLPALTEYDDANHYHDHHELIRRAETALDQSPAAESLSPREVEAQQAFTEMRDEILNSSDGLEVNEVLRIIDNHTPEWV